VTCDINEASCDNVCDNGPYVLVYCKRAVLRLVVLLKVKVNSPVTGLEWPRGSQEVKVPRLHDNGTG
jgi:hypothetical protein